AYDNEKDSLFSLEERVDMIKKAVKGDPRIMVDSFHGLLVDYIKTTKANVIIRGLRATSDFEYEFHMASINKSLNELYDTLFMMTSKDYFFLSSRTIKEIARLGGSVKGFVPEVVEKKLKEKLKEKFKGSKLEC
ncbi:MAG: pantetheine-phosphate adenylyltransferase, partial [Deltaproteobacteria bacterium]|nr:pantetheine-phosphate adenylyltransferase [Deltaproteobacteria bacterium]